MTNNAKVLNKIEKLLALSSSDNLNEACTAMRQANYLMEKHGLNATDMERSKRQIDDKYGARRPAWTKILAYACSRAFGCSSFSGWKKIVFVGRGTSPEIAKYAYDRVSAIVKSIKGENNRKMFCMGACDAIEDFAGHYDLDENNKNKDWMARVENARVESAPSWAIKARHDPAGADAYKKGQNIKIHVPVNCEHKERIEHDK